MRTLLIAITTCLISAMVAPAAVADLILSDVGVAVTEDFNSFGGTGFSPTPTAGQLDSNTWRATGFSEGGTTFGGTFTTGDFARGVSTGGVTTGGTYAFEVGTNDYALGVQQTADDFTPGRLTLRVLNDTGQAITGFNLQADAYFFNDQNRSSTWSIAFSTTDAGDGSYTVLPPPLLSPAAADATPIWDAIPIFAPIQFAAPLENGEQFYVQLIGDDFAGSGSRDEFAIDNLSITATAVPEPSVVCLLGLVAAAVTVRRQRLSPMRT